MFSEPTFVIPKPEKKLSIEPGLVVPGAFRESPWKYFQEHGLNIKPGDTEYKEDGRISEDPTAVKCLPVWHDEAGNPIRVIAKKINTIKSQIGKTGNPWHEVDVMRRVAEAGLPVARLLAVAEDKGEHLFVTERIAGFTVYDIDHIREKFSQYGYTQEDEENLKNQVRMEMEALKNQLREQGIIREKWKLQDMVFEIDFEACKVTRVTPVDWERTKILLPLEEAVRIEEPLKPIWEFPESFLFYEWYEQQYALPEEQRSSSFKQFLDLLASGKAEAPKLLAHYRVKRLREKREEVSL